MLVFPLQYRETAHPRQLREVHRRRERAAAHGVVANTSGTGRRRLAGASAGMALWLSGDVVRMVYYYAMLYIVTPLQPFSLIVDTGSSVTALPCANCKYCSQHMNARFDPAASST